MVNLELFRELPAIDELIRSPQLNPSIQSHGSVAVADAARAVLGRLRDQIASELLDAESLRVAVAGIAGAIETEARKSLTHHLRSVINATGVILHTNLGRAPLANQTLAHVLETANQYSNLEFDLQSGERGKRDIHVDRLFRKLFSEDSGCLDYRRQQQCRSRPVSPEFSCRRRRGDSFTRRTGRDRWIFSNS